MSDLFGEDMAIGQGAFELIEFVLDRQLPDGTTKKGSYGVNVAKVREVVRMPRINPLASTVSSMAGIFELRGIPIPAINLSVALGDPVRPLESHHQIIVTEFSQKRAGFVVQATRRIRRVGWDSVLPPAVDKETYINGMTLIEDNEFLFILDLEHILADVEAKTGGQHGLTAPPPSGGPVAQVARKGKRLLLVDDSGIVLRNVALRLDEAGYDVTTATNGVEAKNCLENDTDFFAVVSDVEMPQMDGLSLTRWIRDNPSTEKLPVILHTSLSGGGTEDAGFAAGADSYVVKNDIKSLIKALDR